MRELIMDHGTEFSGNRILENGKSNSRFRKHLEELGIKPIMARVKHPQTNGKLEKWFDTYRRFRKDFDLLREFIEWYNDRPHGSLDFDRLETQIKRSCEKCLKRLSLESDIGYLDCEIMNNSEKINSDPTRNNFRTTQSEREAIKSTINWARYSADCIGMRSKTIPHLAGRPDLKASSPKSLSNVSKTRSSSDASARTSSSTLPGALSRIHRTS